MKKIFFAFLTLVFFCFTISADRQETLPTVKFSGQEYYCYTAGKDETIYGVAKKFGWDIDKLMDSNPGIEAMLKSKQQILYPVGITVSKNNIPESGIMHKVEQGETVFGIARKYDVSVESIYANNPSSQYGIKSGETLVIGKADVYPHKEICKYQVKPGDTLYGIAKRFNTSVESITSANSGLSGDKLKAGDEILIISGIAGNQYTSAENVSLPEVQVEEPYQKETVVESSDTVAALNADRPINVTVLLAQDNTKRDVDFIRGIMTALKDKIDSDWRVNLNVMSGAYEHLGKLHEDTAFLCSDIVLTTYDKNIPESIALYCDENKIPFVSIFDLKNDLYLSHPYSIQMLPPSDVFNKNTTDAILNRFDGYMYIFCGSDQSDAIGSSMQDAVSPVDRMSISSIRELDNVGITNDSRIVIYAYESSRKDIELLLDGVIRLKQEFPLASISVVGRPNWVIYDDSLLDKFHLANTYIPSRFYYNPQGFEEKSYSGRFRSLTGYNPVRSFPMYSVMGYDLTNYFIPELRAGKEVSDFSNLEYIPLQLDVNFDRQPQGGLLNKISYLLNFTPYSTVDKILIK